MEHKWKKEITAFINGEKVQWCDVDSEYWHDLVNPDSFLSTFDNTSNKFRIVPKTININGHEVPEPCREKLKHRTVYFYPCLSHPNLYILCYWYNDEDDLHLLKIGFVHLTKEDAIKHAEALLSFTKNKDEQ